MTKTSDAELDVYVKSALGKKARNPVLLDVGHLTSLADAFLICHGTSNRQVSAIAEHIQRDLKKQGIKALSVDGLKEGHWVLMDYGHVVIHVFFESTRSFYNLEGLWSDARRIQTESLRQVVDDPDDDCEVDESLFIE
ncbi:MAG: ribosome silencing factor [Desulfosarcina sp.]|nr:ribosome silencing factor [Desulfosarcina sp.]